MEFTIVNQNTDFWDNKSDIAYSALFKYGYDVYAEIGDLENQSKWIYVILNNRQSQTINPIVGYTTEPHFTVKPNVGFSNTGNTIDLNPNNDAGLIALWSAYSELIVLNGNNVTFAELFNIDVAIDPVPKEDFRITIDEENRVINDMASQPYEEVTENGEVVTENGEVVIDIKIF